jgi:protein-tyrosine phosphatase
MDDGSRSVSESVSLVNLLESQGVDTVIATPHFYADNESLSSFFGRREESFYNLKNALGDTPMKIKLGAEVKYYPGISRLNGLHQLCTKGTELLLLEMPMSSWTEYTVRELEDISFMGDIKLILAHIERCMPMQKGNVWERLLDDGIYMQVNASYFLDFFTKRKAISNLRDGKIHFVGSDCHNMTNRPPRLKEAFSRISEKLGDGFIAEMNEYGRVILGDVE